MKTYYVYKETFLFKFYKYVFLTKKDKILYWERDKSDSTQYIPFPDNSQFYSLCRESREQLEKYYSVFYSFPADRHLFDFIKKSVVNDFRDYYCFRKSIELINSSGVGKVIGQNYLQNIYENNNPRKIFLFLNYLFHLIRFFPYIFKIILICFLQNSKDEVPEVIYFKKGAWPDALGINSMKDFFQQKGLSFKGVSFSFSRLTKKYNIYFISSFIGSKKAVIISSFHVIKYAFKDLLMFIRLGIPGKLFYSYLIYSFNALTYMKLGSKVIFGILEKSYCILMDRYKINGQKICTFSDGFAFYPLPGVVYIHSDYFYSMNKMQLSYLSNNQWNFDKIIEVGFIHKNKKAISKGISKDLVHQINDFNFVTLVPLSQVQSRFYYPIGLTYIEKFLYSIVEIAKNNQDDLFIIKEKKGELNQIPNKVIENINKNENIKIVSIELNNYAHKPTPYYSNYNHYEDLLQKVNLVISLAFQSTTVWQALSWKIPAIAYNESFDRSFLSKYKYLEVRRGELENAFNYWKNIDSTGFTDFLQNIDKEINLLNEDGFKNILKHVSNEAVKLKLSQNGY